MNTIRIPLLFIILIILSGCPQDDPLKDIKNRDMILIPQINNFYMGYMNVATPVHTVTSISSFYIGKYEITYELWNEVYLRARSNGYVFSDDSVTTSTGVCGSADNGSNKQPVTMVNWRDCIIWCNAYSIMDGLDPVYYSDAGFTTPITNSNNTSIGPTSLMSGNQDNPYVKWNSNGYRLPTEVEWELCARYIDGTSWLAGDHVSGDTSGYCFNSGNPGTLSTVYPDYAWYSGNASSTNETGIKNAASSGMYDMSGNVYEWCWDWNGTYTTTSPYTETDTRGPDYDASNPYRVIRGGCWSSSNNELQVSNRANKSPELKNNYTGFRVLRKK